MGRQKKDNRPISIRMDREIFERLNQFCDKSGQSKTTAIERAVSEYIDQYDEMIRRASIKKE